MIVRSGRDAEFFNPSPIGRGAGVRVGSRTDVNTRPDPHPALRATFSRWEKGKDIENA